MFIYHIDYFKCIVMLSDNDFLHLLKIILFYNSIIKLNLCLMHYTPISHGRNTILQ